MLLSSLFSLRYRKESLIWDPKRKAFYVWSQDLADQLALPTTWTGLQVDSRKIAPGEVFLAHQGHDLDGHSFLPQAYDKGSRIFVVEKEQEELLPLIQDFLEPCLFFFVTPDSFAKVLGALSALAYDHPEEKLILVGITGTKGKTTSSFYLYEILNAFGIKTGLIGTCGVYLPPSNWKSPFLGQDRPLGLPWSLPRQGPGQDANLTTDLQPLMAGPYQVLANTTPGAPLLWKVLQTFVKAGVKVAVLEYSSQAGKDGRCTGLTFDHAVWLNLFRDHIGPREHPTLEDYRASKAKLFTQARMIHLNCRGEGLAYFEEKAKETGLPLRYFSQEPEGPEPHSSVESEPQSSAESEPRSSAESEPISSALIGSDLKGGPGPLSFGEFFTYTNRFFYLQEPGSFNRENIWAALSVAAEIIPEFSQKLDLLAQITPALKVPGRMNLYPCKDFYCIIDYAHNGVSLRSCLKAVQEIQSKIAKLPKYQTYLAGGGARSRILCLFGSVGGKTKERRRELPEAAAAYASVMMLTSDNPEYEDPEQILADMKAAVPPFFPRDQVFACADRREAIHQILAMAQPYDLVVFAGKGHENFQLIRGKRVLLDELAEIQAFGGQ